MTGFRADFALYSKFRSSRETQTMKKFRSFSEPIGCDPSWSPETVADWLLVALLTALYLWLFAPMRIISRLLGWTRLDWFLLDLLSIPGSILRALGRPFGRRGKVWGLRANALEHTYLVCRMCPSSRQALRDPTSKGICVWNQNWNEGNFGITANFGARNWATQYSGHTDLRDYQYLIQPEPHPSRREGVWTCFRIAFPLRWILSLTINSFLVFICFSPVSAKAAWFFVNPPAAESLEIEWDSVALAPQADRNFPPQGLVAIDDWIVFSNHWQDTHSELFILDPTNGSVLQHASMPTEAKHIAGLAWDGTTLWAVDYGSGYLYRLDYARTFCEGTAAVMSRFDTGLEGASGLTSIVLGDVQYLAISDFLNMERTYVIRLDRVGELESRSIPEIAEISYFNGGFSQGLAWDGTFLYDAVNFVGRDRIQIVDIGPALLGSAREAEILGYLPTPAADVEDLAVRNEELWTSDEGTYEIYRTPQLSEIRTHFLERRGEELANQ